MEIERGIAVEGAVAADINGDGKPDIVVSAGRNNKVFWYERTRQGGSSGSTCPSDSRHGGFDCLNLGGRIRQDADTKVDGTHGPSQFGQQGGEDRGDLLHPGADDRDALADDEQPEVTMGQCPAHGW